MVFKNEPTFMGTTESDITDEQIESAKEKYDDLAEEFLDAVFDVESMLAQHEWEAAVAKHQYYLFNPEEIRKKLGYA